MWTRVPGVIGPMWLAIFIIWAISGLTVKRTVGSKSDARARVLVWGVLLGWFILFNPQFRPGLLGERFVPLGPAAAYAGLGLTVVGLGFALWARFAIGRNWGGAITVQEGHKVVRRGPYALVRHPIYSGFMLATFGTAIAFGEVGGLVATALVVLCWGYKARLEESFMIEQFGAEYEQYRHEVKGLIPGVW
jgi:protein-S-isoprenylcysteine O-methyltransferase Ste14